MSADKKDVVTILSLFKQQVIKKPGALAVAFEDRTLTYSELDRRSSIVANRLILHGASRSVPIAICVERSLEMIIGILGILKAGAAWIPIDPEFPGERIKLLLSDSGVSMILLQKHLDFAVGGDITSFYLDKDFGPGEIIDQEERLPLPNDLAYIIYTSGSTGKPKGVMVSHENILAHIEDVQEALDLDDCGSFALIASFSADAGLTALFSALCYGKSLSVVSKRQLTNTQSMSNFFKHVRVDCYKITPSLLKVFLDSEHASALLPSKKLVLGGEASSWDLVDRIRSIGFTGDIYNHYGPTETSVGVIAGKITPDIVRTGATLPLGRPMKRVRHFIVDEYLQSVSQGEEGELLIEGPFVAVGYLNDEKKTSEKFVSTDINGVSYRVYKTGDVVKYSDGRIHYLGRRDDQVKIGGHRIEPHEIESEAMKHCSQLKECVVHTSTDETGNKFLVGYIVTDQDVDTKNLTHLLLQSLPRHLVPAVWMKLESIPLTTNGKVNRKALPQPNHVHDRSVQINDTSIHQRLISTWEKVLHARPIGSNDKFFELGGDSLAFIRLSNEFYHQFQVPLPDRLSIGDLCVAELAKYLEQRLPIPNDDDDPPEEFNKADVTLSQRQFYFRHKFNPTETFPNTSITFSLSRPLDVDVLTKHLNTVINDHDSLRAGFSFTDGRVIETVHESIGIEVSVHTYGEQRLDQIIRDLTKPFNLSSPPLIRVFLIKMDHHDYLHFYLPHINSDGFSLFIILQQIERLYKGDSDRSVKPQFSEFKKHLSKYLNSEKYRDDEKFWKEYLSDTSTEKPPDPLELNTKETPGSSLIVTISDDINKAISKYQNGKNITRYHIVLGAYLLLLRSIFHEDNVGTRIPVNNRHSPGAQGIVGLLANNVFLRMPIENNMNASVYLHHVRDEVVKVLRHQQYPFEHLRSSLKIPATSSRSMHTSYFGYQNHNFSYQFGDSSLTMCLPEVAKETMYVAANVFDMPHGCFLRLSSNAKGLGEVGLNSAAASFINILSLLVSDVEITIDDIVLAHPLESKKITS